MNVELSSSPVDVLSWVQVGPIKTGRNAMIWCASTAQQTRVELEVIMGNIDLLDIQVVTPIELATQRSKVQVLSVTERRAVLAGFLNSGQASLGPTLRELLSQPSGIDEIASALDEARLMSAGREEVLVHSGAHSHAAWAELAELIDGYTDTLTHHGVTDLVGCFTGFASEFRDDFNVKQFWNDTPHFLALEVDRFTRPALRMLTSLLGPSRPTNPAAPNPAAATSATCQGILASPTIGGQWLRRSAQLNNPTAVTEIAAAVSAVSAAEAPRHQTQPAQTPVPRLIPVKHPSMEAEAVVGELDRAHDEGLSWTSMFVVSPSTRSRLRSVARAASRAGIPIQGGPPPRLDGPIVDLITDLAAGIEHLEGETLISCSPSEFVRTQIQRFLPDLGQRDNDVIEVALGLVRHAEKHDSLSLADWVLTLEQSPTAPTPPLTGPRNAVTLTTIDELRDVLATRNGQETPLVIIIGCVEGELPARPAQATFPAYVLDGPSDEPKRIAAHIASERWKLESIKQQTSSLTLIAAPDPGVLVSRFAEGIEKQQPVWKVRTIDRTRWNPSLATTQNDTPLVPEQKLSLSATQLTMFENCPWQYTVQYRLGLRTGGGVSARFGSYVHTVLETFLAPFATKLATTEPATQEADTEPETQPETQPETLEAPQVPIEHTLEGLLALASRLWTDDIIDHASQSDDFHQRAVDQFTNWWSREGERLVTSNEVAFVEYPFNIPIGEHRLKGFIDRIDQTPTGGVAIIDYKTGAAKTTAQVGDDLQLAVYHLAAVLDPTIAALGTVETLTLNYLKDSREIRQPIVGGHELVTKARIESLIDEILDESHEPSTHANCDYCDLYRLCDLQLAGRPVPIALATKARANK